MVKNGGQVMAYMHALVPSAVRSRDLHGCLMQSGALLWFGTLIFDSAFLIFTTLVFLPSAL